MSKPFSQACENNKEPILGVLHKAFAHCRYVLEIGSGTGQHAVYFAEQLPHLQWQPTDQPEYLPGIRAWCDEADLNNLLPPQALEVCSPWPIASAEAVFSANTLHIMHWKHVEAFFRGLSEVMGANSVLCVYGPFNYGGDYTSESNARFDQWLKARDPLSGIRDVEAICALAHEAGLELRADHTMPANNRLLEFYKSN